MTPRPPASSASESSLRGPVPALTPAHIARLRDALARSYGVFLDALAQRVLEGALLRRLLITGGEPDSYLDRVATREGHDELRCLAELVLNHETFFFRNKPHMRALRETLLPELVQRKPIGTPLRIWSAGCSTGEEPYSLAITVLETLGANSGTPVEIWATDLSETALARAREGVYQGRALANVSPELLERYFTSAGRGYAVGEQLRRMVRFEQLNLLESFPQAARNVDMIFCQNVLIYFQLDTCRAVLERFYDSLPEGGLLFLGFSETLWNVFDRFRAREVGGAYVYSKESQPMPTARLNLPRKPQSGPANERPSSPPVKMRLRPEPQQHVPHRQPRVTARPNAPSVPVTRASDAAPSDATLLEQARELLAAFQPDQALEALMRIAPTAAVAPQALTLMARIHADRGEVDLAIAAVKRAVQQDPMNEDSYVLLGLLHGRQGQWQEAARQFERARYLAPQAPLISFRLAEAYLRQQNTEQAAREYRATLRKLEPHPPDTLLDGVAVAWLRQTCQRQLEHLAR
ncbi:MAG: protein-glutamate O-methyltransferase CheR [Roseiflexaceae bacterium]